MIKEFNAVESWAVCGDEYHIFRVFLEKLLGDFEVFDADRVFVKGKVLKAQN